MSLPTAMGSGRIPAIGLREAGDGDLPLTGAGNPIFPGKEEAAAHHTCQGQEHLSHMQCPNRNTQRQSSISLQTINIITGAASYLPLPAQSHHP